MVEVGDGEFSRELCGGTHVRSTAQVGLFRVLSETSSAANVRRVEAVTGPVGVELMREHDRALVEVARVLRTSVDGVVEAVAAREGRLRECAIVTFVVPAGCVSPNDQIGWSPLGALMVMRILEPARYAWPS